MLNLGGAGLLVAYSFGLLMATMAVYLMLMLSFVHDPFLDFRRLGMTCRAVHDYLFVVSINGISSCEFYCWEPLLLQ